MQNQAASHFSSESFDYSIFIAKEARKPTCETPRRKQQDDDHQLMDNLSPRVPRLDTRKIATLNRVKLPETVRDMALCRDVFSKSLYSERGRSTTPRKPYGKTGGSSPDGAAASSYKQHIGQSALRQAEAWGGIAKKLGDQDEDLSQGEPADSSQPVTPKSEKSRNNFKARSPRLLLAKRNSVTADDMIKSDRDVETILTPAESPAMRQYLKERKMIANSATHQQLTNYSGVDVRVGSFCYRPQQIESPELRDVRIKNIYGPEGYKPEKQDESDGGGTAPKVIHDVDMVADVFKTEGKVIRDLILCLNASSIRWLKAEFMKERTRALNGPQFISKISQLLRSNTSFKEEDDGSDDNNEKGGGSNGEKKSQKKIVGYGLGTYKSKTVKKAEVAQKVSEPSSRTTRERVHE